MKREATLGKELPVSKAIRGTVSMQLLAGAENEMAESLPASARLMQDQNEMQKTLLNDRNLATHDQSDAD